MASEEKGEGHQLNEHGVEHLTEDQLFKRDQERLKQLAQDQRKALDELRTKQNEEIEKAGVRSHTLNYEY